MLMGKCHPRLEYIFLLRYFLTYSLSQCSCTALFPPLTYNKLPDENFPTNLSREPKISQIELLAQFLVDDKNQHLQPQLHHQRYHPGLDLQLYRLKVCQPTYFIFLLITLLYAEWFQLHLYKTTVNIFPSSSSETAIDFMWLGK